MIGFLSPCQPNGKLHHGHGHRRMRALSIPALAGRPESEAILETWFTIGDAWTDLATEDPTGQVQRGSITITGRVFRANFIDTLDDVGLNNTSSHNKFGLCMENSGPIIQQWVDATNYVHFDFPANPFRHDGKSVINREGIKCIRMARYRYGMNNYCLHYEYTMVVQQLPLTNTYQRIGMVVLSRVSDKDGAWEHPERLWEEDPSIFAEGGVVETITIV
jgi:hypothetical protein